MNTANIASTISDLRRLREQEGPSTVIDNAIAYLDRYLEQLCTHELPTERGRGFQMHRELIYPLYEYDSYSDIIWAKVRADVEVSIDEFLSNYESVYGFEPVIIRDALPYFDKDKIKGSFIRRYDDQLEFRGYKIYKKKVR